MRKTGILRVIFIMQEQNVGILEENWKYFMKEAFYEELLYQTGIIYLILNTYDLKGYIGKSKNSFSNRYSGCQWWLNNKNKPSNILLDRIIKKYGHTQFNIFILESGIKDHEELKQRERFWANKFKTYAPNGYNVRECGEAGGFYGPMAAETKRLLRLKMLKKYKLQRISDGTIFEITDLPHWCSEMKVKSNKIRNVLCDLVKTSEDFCLPKNFHKLSKTPPNCKLYKFKEVKTGNIIKIPYLSKFCKDNNLNAKEMRRVYCCYRKEYMGYGAIEFVPRKKYSYKRLYIKKDSPRKTNVNYIFEKDGKSIAIQNLAHFSRQNNIHYGMLKQLILGRSKQYKGYTFKSREILRA